MRWTLILVAVVGCSREYNRSEVASGISGRVVRLAEGTAQPVNDAVCSLEPTTRAVTTGDTGEFAFLDLPAGTYYVICRYDAGGESLSVLARAALEEGESAALGDLTLKLSGRVEGTVQLMGAEDHSGVSVFIPGTQFDATSSAEGSFAIADVPESELSLRLERDGYLPMTVVPLRVVAGETLHLDIVLLGLNTGANGSLLLAGGAGVSTSREVTVTVAAAPAALSMLLSENSAFVGAEPRQVVPSLTWEFAQEGPATLYARFLDGDGLSGAMASDSVVIDSAPPAGSIVIDGGALATNATEVVLAITASDTTGAVAMAITNELAAPVQWQPFAADVDWSLAPGDGVKNVYVWLRDGQGLVSEVTYDAIELDTQPPAPGGITFPRGNVVAGTAVEVELTGPEAAQMVLSEGAGRRAAQGPQPYARRFTWELEPGADGPRLLTLTLLDLAGNASASASTQVWVDTQPPTTPALSSGPGPVLTSEAEHTLTLSVGSTDAHLAGYELIGGGNTSHAVWTPAGAAQPLAVQLFAEGCYALGVRGVDAADNTSEPAWVTVCLDQTPPEVSYDLRLLAVSGGTPNQNIMRLTAAADAGASCMLSFAQGGGAPTLVAASPEAVFSVPEQTLVSYDLQCTDAAGNTAAVTFAESSGTGVLPSLIPPSPWTAAGSPYWVMGTVVVAGPVSLGPGVSVRRGGSGGPAVLDAVDTLDGNGTAGPVLIDDVSLNVQQIILTAAEIRGGETTVQFAMQITDSVLMDHGITSPRVEVSSALLRNVLVDTRLDVILAPGVVFDLHNNLLLGTSQFRVEWPAPGEAHVVRNSFMQPGALVLRLIGPAGSGPGSPDLSVSENYWSTQDPNVVDAMVFMQADTQTYGGLDLIDVLPALPHPDTPAWP